MGGDNEKKVEKHLNGTYIKWGKKYHFKPGFSELIQDTYLINSCLLETVKDHSFPNFRTVICKWWHRDGRKEVLYLYTHTCLTDLKLVILISGMLL